MEDHCYSQDWPAFSADAAANLIPGSDSVFDESFLVPWLVPPGIPTSDRTQLDGFPPWSSSIQESAEEKAASISKSHRQAEKRRRDRINTQLGILRKIIPKSDKMDKAALLGSAIDHIKDLKRKAMEVSEAYTFPTEVDEVTVDCEVPEGIINPGDNNINTNKNNQLLIKASLCCEDRPELFSELIRVLKGHRLSIVRADICSVGGRIKSILVVGNMESKEGVSVSTVKQSLNIVLSRISSSCVPPSYRIRSKRQRFFLPSHSS